ncbi:MAG TPA: peptidylprolyl isomerase [Bacteroidales bacterium]|nr:peptidylprolyl isomerase [Bacteroidales bacterium]HOK98248.1 peptidylprolyl isomerase [Bacteroidales bacterium]HPO65657.1 peptidylprolyl isomerase [Bacteroidales bacterium]
MAKYLLAVLLLFFTGWCKKQSDNPPVAKVGNAVLYKSDLARLIQPGMTLTDSNMLAKSIIDKWVRKQLIMQQALLNLTDAEKNVEKELEEYRTSLIIYKYEQKYIQERLDTTVTEQEMQKYYADNLQSFILPTSVAKVQFVQLPLAVKTDLVRQWLLQANEESVKKIQEFCYQVAVKYEYFGDRWVSFDNIKMLFPYALVPSDQYMMSNKLYETSDTSYHYLLYLREIKPKGAQAPYEFVRDNIRNIIILKRKQKLVNDLENNIYLDALNKNKFTIYE